ncbi:GNAT family N-acetyltransferase [Methylobacterium sp. J-068]|uniref:GNAT family N-acetyltransferase n=1 Tax=Methylobacterium sp. J-068 TaxID=2836649 RepID=UPI001FBACB0F|nr:GNAT family N-acetyltransferase [Methylobacterium sp. J-068]MCJ2035408.1 GNAT family N-acetyltransferase [Methylobacterium sp. J-068]
MSSPSDWRHFHTLRRDILWTARGRTGYDENHPDDRRPDHHPLLLKCQDGPVGVVRLDDRRDGTGIVRLVAIAPDRRGQGLGRALGAGVEAKARGLNIDTLFVNAVPDAVGFYEAMDWERFCWDTSELVGDAANCVQMRKILRARS